MGQNFIDFPTFDLSNIFIESSIYHPILFLLSAGADPVTDIIQYANTMRYDKKMRILSLGQGQGPIAEQALSEGMDKGYWILLQNCHLAVSWLPTLCGIFDSIANDVSPNFRLWLTSNSITEFPISILQNSIKIAQEPAQGLRANLLNIYGNLDPKLIQSNKQQYEFHCLLYGLSFFHGIIQERRKYGSIGWNIPYEFTDSDFKISLSQLMLFLNEETELPFLPLIYLTGECNYGGRVTDSWDRRCIITLLSEIYCNNILDLKNILVPGYPQYKIPETTDIYEIVEEIKAYPINETPLICGLHQNAEITLHITESNTFISNLQLIQLSTSQSSSTSSQSNLSQVVNDLIEKVINYLNSIDSSIV